MAYWTYGSVSILVEEDSGPTPEPRVDLISPLALEYVTYIHQAGRESYTRRIKCVCIENYGDLKTLADGESHALVSDQGSLGNWIITSIKGERMQDSRATPVVRVVPELTEVT